MPIAYARAEIAAADQFTAPVRLQGLFNLSIERPGAAWTATVTVQRSFDGGATWNDVEAFGAPAQRLGYEPEDGVLYRAGCKAGEFTSGVVPVRLSR